MRLASVVLDSAMKRDLRLTVELLQASVKYIDDVQKNNQRQRQNQNTQRQN